MGKSCYYEALVGVAPLANDCKKLSLTGCEGCEFFLIDPEPIEGEEEDFDQLPSDFL